MKKTLTEAQVLKILDIDNFRYLSKEKVITLVGLLDQMDPEVAKKAIEQFPNFAKTMKEIFMDFKENLDKGLDVNKDSINSVHNSYNSIIESCLKLLDDEELTLDQKVFVINKAELLAEKQREIDTDNKIFIFAMSVLGLAALGTTSFALASALGVNVKLNIPKIK